MMLTSQEGTRLRTARYVVGYAAILGTLPYLTLKIAWLTGGTLGLVDPDLMRNPTMYVANALTGGMDLVAILIALALTHAWGMRLPAWLVLFPTWVGTGFLAPIVLASPVLGFDLLTASGPMSGLHEWVRPVVYGSFAWQGVTLLTAFALYARVRWAAVFRPTRESATVGPLGVVGGLLGILVGGAHLVSAADASGPFLTTAVLDVVYALAAFAAAAAVFARGWPAVVVAWAGSAMMFAWGFWGLVTAAAGHVPAPFWLLVDVGRFLAGALLGLALLRHTAGRTQIARSNRRRGAYHEECPRVVSRSGTS